MDGDASYRPIGENPDPAPAPAPAPAPEPPPAGDPQPDQSPIDDPLPDSANPLPRSADDNPAHDASAAPDD